MDKRSKVHVNPSLRRVDTSGKAQFYLEDSEKACFELGPEILDALELCRTPVPIATAFDTSRPDWQELVEQLLKLSILRSEEREGHRPSSRIERVPETAFAVDPLHSADTCKGAIVIVGACTDAGTLPQYPRGAARGPAEIRRESQSIALRERLTDGAARGWYDFETEEFLLQGARILDGGDVIHRAGTDLASYLRDLGGILEDIRIREGRFVVLGGDHSVTAASVGLFQATDIGVIHFDAHTDLGLIGYPADINHGNVLRHLLNLEHVKHVLTIGLRGLQPNRPCEEKHEFQSVSQIRAITSSGLPSLLRSDLRYYISVDIDVLDPSVARATAAPSPDGLSLRELRLLIRGISRGREIIGADLVEVQAEAEGRSTTASAAAEVAIELMNAIWHSLGPGHRR